MPHRHWIYRPAHPAADTELVFLVAVVCTSSPKMWAPKIIVAETPAQKKAKLVGTVMWVLLLLAFFGGVINKFISTKNKRDMPLMKSGYDSKVRLELHTIVSRSFAVRFTVAMH